MGVSPLLPDREWGGEGWVGVGVGGGSQGESRGEQGLVYALHPPLPKFTLVLI